MYTRQATCSSSGLTTGVYDMSSRADKVMEHCSLFGRGDTWTNCHGRPHQRVAVLGDVRETSLGMTLCLQGITAHTLYHSNTDHGDNYMCMHPYNSGSKSVQCYRDCNTFYRILYDALVAVARFESRLLMRRIKMFQESLVGFSLPRCRGSEDGS